jgi:hypothetical protein
MRKPMDKLRIIHLLIHLLLLIVIILFILTGFGITNYQIIEPLTFGALSKLTAYQLHTNLIIPFLILLGGHFLFIVVKKVHKTT